jgi:lactate permease
VSICGTMMGGLGFEPFAAAVLCLIANTSPVAFGGIGNPVRALVAVTGLPAMDQRHDGRILPVTALILPFWLSRMVTSWRNVWSIWPGLLLAGAVFAGIQFYWSNYVDFRLVDITGGLATLIALTLFLKVWKPEQNRRFAHEPPATVELHHYSPAADYSHVVGLSARPSSPDTTTNTATPVSA